MKYALRKMKPGSSVFSMRMALRQLTEANSELWPVCEVPWNSETNEIGVGPGIWRWKFMATVY